MKPYWKRLLRLVLPAVVAINSLPPGPAQAAVLAPPPLSTSLVVRGSTSRPKEVAGPGS